jgi:hypothetical protein
VLLFAGVSFAPMLEPLLAAEAAPHETCMRQEHACHHHSDSTDTSVRGNARCEHDCCRGLTLRTAAAMPLDIVLQARPVGFASVALQGQSSYRFQQRVSRPARAPPVVTA